MFSFYYSQQRLNSLCSVHSSFPLYYPDFFWEQVGSEDMGCFIESLYFHFISVKSFFDFTPLKISVLYSIIKIQFPATLCIDQLSYLTCSLPFYISIYFEHKEPLNYKTSLWRHSICTCNIRDLIIYHWIFPYRFYSYFLSFILWFLISQVVFPPSFPLQLHCLVCLVYLSFLLYCFSFISFHLLF